MQAKKSTLTAGDVVRLKSNGPQMTVGLINRDELKCFWVDSEETVRVFEWNGFLPNPIVFDLLEPSDSPVEFPIQAGCQVNLRSSRTPIMTVNAIRKNTVYHHQEAECIWFTSDEKQLCKLIPVKALIPSAEVD
jgi:uncharacterized protein YodC (DUF2158 family)